MAWMRDGAGSVGRNGIPGPGWRRGMARALAAGLVSLTLAGCAITDEFRRHGGFADRVFDVVMPADAREHRVFRGYLILGILARLGSESPVNLDDREALVMRVRQSVQAANEALRCARDRECAFLEDRIAVLDRRLFRLAVAVLYPEETRDFMVRIRDSLLGKVPVVGRAANAAKAAATLLGETAGAMDDLAGAINALLDLGYEAARTSQRLGPIYRDSVALDLRMLIDSLAPACGEAPVGGGPAVIAHRAPDGAAPDCGLLRRARELYRDGGGEIAAWGHFLRHDARAHAVFIVPARTHWIEASSLIWTACDLLHSDDDQRESCRGGEALIHGEATRQRLDARRKTPLD